MNKSKFDLESGKNTQTGKNLIEIQNSFQNVMRKSKPFS